MPYTKLSAVPASLRGIEPPITLAQANGIARCADELKTKGEVESPWAVCIASFKKSHIATGGKWVRRKEKKTMDTVEIDGTEVRLEKLIAAYKAVSEHEERLPAQATKFLPVKMLSETTDAWIIGGYGLIWGSEHVRDLTPWSNQDGTHGEYFTPETKGLDDIPVKAMTFEHDQETDEDGNSIKEAVGHTILERDDMRGRWIEAQLSKGREYARLVVDLMSKGNLYLSSETAGHWREVAADGEIKRWRTAGYTFTTHPMEPRIGSVSQVKAAYKAAGLDFPQLNEGGESAGADCQKTEVERERAKIELMLAEIELEVNR